MGKKQVKLVKKIIYLRMKWQNSPTIHNNTQKFMIIKNYCHIIEIRLMKMKNAASKRAKSGNKDGVQVKLS